MIKVWKVCYKKTGKIYAIKEMSKAKIIDKKSIDNVLGEKLLLSQLHHPFIVNMIYSFQDHDNLYLVMDLLPGGNLRYHISIKRRFTEKQNKFLIGCILVGLEYIHCQNILHRDIKPENLVFDSRGYLRITDFGIAKKYKVNNRKDTSGTVGYLAPEVLCNENHNFSIDYYAVGIITFELAYGHRPYIGKTKSEVKHLILTRQAQIDYDELPEGYSNEAADFINKLIQRKPKNRLGKNSIKEVINHPWLEGFDWEELKKKNLEAFFIPKIGDNFDKKFCLKSDKMSTDTIERYKQITMEPNYKFVFKDFDCKIIPEELKIYNTKDNIGENLNNNNSSNNNSTILITKNNKKDINIINNKNGKENKNNNFILGKQRNKSLENIFQKIDNENKELNRHMFGVNIINNFDKENNNSNKNQYFNININNNIFDKQNDNNFVNKLSIKSNKYKDFKDFILEKNNIYIINNGNKNIINLSKGKNSLFDSSNFSSQKHDKSVLNDNFGNISKIDKNRKNENDINKEKEKERKLLIINDTKKMTNLNQYLANYKKNNFINNSNSNINIFTNNLFYNNKGSFIRKDAKHSIGKEPIKVINNSLSSSNSTKSIFKKSPNFSKNTLSKTRKQFLKKEIFNGTFYPNKSTNRNFFIMSNSNKIYKKRKASLSLINKNSFSNKRLTSSYSNQNLIKKNKDKDGIDISEIMPNIETGKNTIEVKHIDKRLPAINSSLYKTKGNFFRNKFHLVNSNKNILNQNVFFSQRIINNEKK